MFYYDIEEDTLKVESLQNLIVLKKGRTLKDCVIVTEEQAEYIFICDDCGEIINTNDDEKYTTYNGYTICQDCYENDYFTCEDCGEIHHIDDIYTVNSGTRNESYVCDNCINDYYRCDECGNYFSSEYTNTDDYDGCYCDDCLERYDICRCENCGRLTSDIYFCEGTEEYLCEDCYNDSENVSIHDYGYTPELEFYKHNIEGSTPLYYGFELEVHTDRSQADTYLNHFTQNNIYLTNDSSIIEGGYEITSHPLTYNYIFKSHFYDELKKSLKFLQDIGSKGHNYGGLHLHISNENITDLQLAIMACILYNTEDSKAYNTILTITQRKKAELEEWSSLKTFKTKKELLEYVNENGYIDYTKYTGINCKHGDTIEFRIFNSTLRIDRLQKNFQFIRALVNYSKYLVIKANRNIENINIDELSIFNLFEYILKNNKHHKYDVLIAFLYEKNILQPQQLPLLQVA